MLILSDKDIKKVFTMKDAICTNKETFIILSEGKSNDLVRASIQSESGNGTFSFMPYYLDGLECSSFKLSTDPHQLLLIDGRTGLIIAILDGKYLTQLYMGASTGAALDILARKNSKKGALVGANEQSIFQLEAMIEVCNLEEIRIYDLDLGKAKKLENIMKKRLKPYSVKVTRVYTVDESLKDADVIVIEDSPQKWRFNINKVKKGSTIIHTGYIDKSESITYDKVSKIYFNSKESIPRKSRLNLRPNISGEIGSVLLGKIAGRENDDEIIVYESINMGLLDLMTARTVYVRAKQEGVGDKWDDLGNTSRHLS